MHNNTLQKQQGHNPIYPSSYFFKGCRHVGRIQNKSATEIHTMQMEYIIIYLHIYAYKSMYKMRVLPDEEQQSLTRVYRQMKREQHL